MRSPIILEDVHGNDKMQLTGKRQAREMCYEKPNILTDFLNIYTVRNTIFNKAHLVQANNHKP